MKSSAGRLKGQDSREESGLPSSISLCHSTVNQVVTRSGTGSDRENRTLRSRFQSSVLEKHRRKTPTVPMTYSKMALERQIRGVAVEIKQGIGVDWNWLTRASY